MSSQVADIQKLLDQARKLQKDFVRFRKKLQEVGEVIKSE